MQDIAEFLKDHEPFSELDRAELDRLAERAEVEFFAEGTTIFKQGERPQDRVHVIRRGAVELVDCATSPARFSRGRSTGPVVAADVSGFDLAQQPCRALIREQPVTCEPSCA